MSRVFDGNTNRIDIPETGNPEPTAGVTLACWFYSTNSTPNFQHLIVKAAAATWVSPFAVWALRIQGPPMVLTGWVNDAGITANVVIGTTTITQNAWQHGVFTFDGVTLRLFLNAIPDTTKALSASINTSTFPIHLGSRTAGSGDALLGNLFDAAVWNVALTLPEIRKLAFGYRPNQVRPQNLFGYWPLDEAGGLALDRSGYNNIGTPQGATVSGNDSTLVWNRRQGLILPPATLFKTPSAGGFNPAWCVPFNQIASGGFAT